MKPIQKDIPHASCHQTTDSQRFIHQGDSSEFMQNQGSDLCGIS